jgi:phosphatidylglycerol:prolipoprotein diacylglycerol transferase
MTFAINFPNISPNIFSFEVFGVTLALRWYALAYVAGILLGVWLIAVMARRPALWANRTPALTPKHAEALITWLVLGIILGGRLGFVLFYQPTYYLSHLSEIPRVWQGGMSFHGGFLGVVVTLILFSRFHKVNVISLGDCVAAVTPIGLFLGRVANFINAELWGKPTVVPWGVIFPGEAAQTCATITQACARHPSQLYEAALEGVLLFAIMMWLVWRRGALKAPGRLMGVFFLFYGLSRMFIELFRQADEQYITAENPMGYVLQFGEWGLSMGQVLSLPMVLVGLAVLLRSRKIV